MLDQQSSSMRGGKKPWLIALLAALYPMCFMGAVTLSGVVAYAEGIPWQWCVGAAVALTLPACLVIRTRIIEYWRAVSALERSGALTAMSGGVSKLLHSYASTSGRRWVAYLACAHTLHFPPTWGEVEASFRSRLAKPRLKPFSKSWWASYVQPINYW